MFSPIRLNGPQGCSGSFVVGRLLLLHRSHLRRVFGVREVVERNLNFCAVPRVRREVDVTVFAARGCKERLAMIVIRLFSGRHGRL